MHRRMLLVGVVVLLAVAFLVGSAGADPANNPANRNGLLVELNCPTGTLTGVTIAQNNAVPFQIVGETQVAVAKTISFVDLTDPTGTVVVVLDNPGVGHGREDKLVTCTYTEPDLFPNLLITGEFLFTAKP
ncbi:MAG TPA: hypothetical protein VF486_20070 [Actinomycetes bacterium]